MFPIIDTLLAHSENAFMALGPRHSSSSIARLSEKAAVEAMDGAVAETCHTALFRAFGKLSKLRFQFEPSTHATVIPWYELPRMPL